MLELLVITACWLQEEGYDLMLLIQGCPYALTLKSGEENAIQGQIVNTW